VERAAAALLRTRYDEHGAHPRALAKVRRSNVSAVVIELRRKDYL
jgi:hypothetical protein